LWPYHGHAERSSCLCLLCLFPPGSSAKRRSSNANSLWWGILAEPTEVIATSRPYNFRISSLRSHAKILAGLARAAHWRGEKIAANKPHRDRTLPADVHNYAGLLLHRMEGPKQAPRWHGGGRPSATAALNRRLRRRSCETSRTTLTGRRRRPGHAGKQKGPHEHRRYETASPRMHVRQGPPILGKSASPIPAFGRPLRRLHAVGSPCLHSMQYPHRVFPVHFLRPLGSSAAAAVF